MSQNDLFNFNSTSYRIISLLTLIQHSNYLPQWFASIVVELPNVNKEDYNVNR